MNLLRTKTWLIVLLLAGSAQAVEPKVQRDIAYAGAEGDRRKLDIFSPPDGKLRPIVFWIHGGGWRRGDKSHVQKKPQAFVDQGCVFVAANYRFVPQVTVKEMTADIAKALRWVHDHAPEFGGDPKSIYVMGHSAGAHLAALVCTDDRYLKAEGLSLAILRGCVPVDVSVYDIPKRLTDGGSVTPATITETFGANEELQRELSPAAHVAKDKQIPPFLILHVASRPETRSQSQWLADKLQAAGVAAQVVAAVGKDHGSINAELGLPDDKPTQAVMEFLQRTRPTEKP